MNKQDLSQIALKLLGIYALLESIQLLGGALSVFAFPDDMPFYRYVMILSTLVPFIILVWSGLFLIRKTDKISTK